MSLFSRTTTSHPIDWKHVTVKSERAATVPRIFPAFRSMLPLKMKEVQVSCMNVLYDGIGFRNDNGGMEFFCDAYQECLSRHLSDDISLLSSELDFFKGTLAHAEACYSEGAKHVSEWSEDLSDLNRRYGCCQEEQHQLILRGRVGDIEASERERRRYVLRKELTAVRRSIATISNHLDNYRKACQDVFMYRVMLNELDSEIADKECRRKVLSTLTVGKSGIMTILHTQGFRQKGCCLFSCFLDFVSYMYLVYETGYKSFPRGCDCIILNDYSNFMKMLLSVDTYDSIYCFFPATMIGKCLEQTIIQRGAPRAVSMAKYYDGYVTLFEYLLSLDR